MMSFVLASLGILAVIALAYSLKKLGKIENQKSKAEARNEMAIQAKHVHDRLARDDRYAKRVRERFKR